jgi:hypothetical protein
MGPVEVDVSGWSGEGEFTQTVVDALRALDEVALVRVEDAPATRSEADYNFISNEIYVVFRTRPRTETVRRLGFWRSTRRVEEKSMTLGALHAAFGARADVGEPDYADDGMLQYLRTERIVPPYQTRGYKLVELVRIYEAGATPRR